VHETLQKFEMTVPPPGSSDIAADIRDEALRVTSTATASGLSLRVIGGLAVSLRCPSAAVPPLRRDYADIDLAGRASERRATTDILTSAGYIADQQFNALHGARRLFFWDDINQRQLDVFLDTFEMCHTIEFRSRLNLDPVTLPLADLLLMKLQIFETNEKDLMDIVALFSDHDLTDDEAGINIAYIGERAASDWGLWRTTTEVAGRARDYARGLNALGSASHVCAQIDSYIASLEERPKTRAWKVRARIGERKRWYELPDESH
jgi:hypothetical protein